MTSLTIVAKSDEFSSEEAENLADYLLINIGFKAIFDKVLINNKEYYNVKNVKVKDD